MVIVEADADELARLAAHTASVAAGRVYHRHRQAHRLVSD
jgi:hypothetical protein